VGWNGFCNRTQPGKGDTGRVMLYSSFKWLNTLFTHVDVSVLLWKRVWQLLMKQ